MKTRENLLVVLVLVGVVALATRAYQGLRLVRCEDNLAQCRQNLKKIAIAIEGYGTEDGGHYLQRFGDPLRASQSAEALQSLVPQYLERVPTCPASGKTYVVTACNPDPDYFYVSCFGAAHRELGVPAHFPADGTSPCGDLLPRRHPVPFEQRRALPVDLQFGNSGEGGRRYSRKERDAGWGIMCPIDSGDSFVDDDEGSLGVASWGDMLYKGTVVVAQLHLNDDCKEAEQAVTALLGPPDHSVLDYDLYERPGGTLIFIKGYSSGVNLSRSPDFGMWRPSGG